jgi:hypothetical protein
MVLIKTTVLADEDKSIPGVWTYTQPYNIWACVEKTTC